jgi:integrase
VFRYAIVTGRAERDPAADLRGALITSKTQHRSAITDPREIGALMRAIDAYRGSTVTRLALRLLALCFTRPGELRLAEWSEIDLQAAVWNIPAKRTKMRRPHRVPLSRQAIQILRELHAVTGDGRYVFPSFYSQGRCLSENALTAALRRMGYAPEEMCAHGFRGMASTRLNEMRLDGDVVELALGHQDRSVTRRSYNHAERWDDRIALMQTWADELDKLRSEIIR